MIAKNDLLRLSLALIPKSLLWAFARRFIAGKNMANALSTASALNTEGFHVSLDYIGEGCANRAEIKRVTSEYLALVTKMRQHGVRGDISLKLSHLGLLRKNHAPSFESFGREAFTEILFRAEQIGIRVWVDAEELKYRARMWEIIAQHPYPLFFPHLGVCIQAYAEDAVIFLNDHLQKNKDNSSRLAIRVCKGAYREPDHYLLKGKLLEENFLRLCASASAHGCFLQAATHDERLIRRIKELPNEYGMLLGVRPSLAKTLLRERKRVNIYTAYGPDFKPYILRRITEHPSYIFLPFTRA